MSIYEYNEELHLATVRQEGYEDGLSEGIAQGITQSILELLENLGTVPKSVREEIEKQKDMEKLSKWLKLAAKSQTLEEFEEKL